MVWLSNYFVSRQHMNIYWVKESFGSLMDAHMSVWLFDASLKTLGDLVWHSKEQKLLGCWTFGLQQHMIQ